MSWQASEWAAQRVYTDGTSKCVLLVMAEAADERGCGVWLSQTTIAERTGFTDRTVRTALGKLEAQGLIRLGNAALVGHLPPSQQPTVWNLNLRVVHDAPPAKKKSTRAKKPPETPSSTPPETNSTPGNSFHDPRKLFPAPPETPSATPGKSFRQTAHEPPYEPPVEPHAHTREDNPAAPSHPETLDDHIDALCEKLRSRVEANNLTPDPPHITRGWRNAARALLQLDNREFQKVTNLIDWCQDHHFWRTVVHDMPSFHRHYKRIHQQAVNDWRTKKAEAHADIPLADRRFRDLIEQGQRLQRLAATQNPASSPELANTGFFAPLRELEANPPDIWEIPAA
ncbi:helix-turn-helix domain-containing protein [Nocardia sp. CC227C]|uniref:helix-turn-helix domain-containing protein n=1 Tax=Nocardia sp. CC227C TaxID=3044562 RepID=UPI00278BE92C|nr:helix-turn-helix domain-containing protein [Nocardia sp. CC227C]